MYINIDVERVRARMTLEELADKLGITRTAIYSWQHSGRIPTPYLVKMADIFGCSTDYLLGRTENRQVNR